MQISFSFIPKLCIHYDIRLVRVHRKSSDPDYSCATFNS